MGYFILTPEISKVRALVKMLPEQYDPALTEIQFDAQIGTIIEQATTYVEGKMVEAGGGLGPFFTEEQVHSALPNVAGWCEMCRQQDQSRTVSMYEAAARLWEQAGALEDEYDEESDRWRALADRELTSLTTNITLVADALRAAAAVPEVVEPAPENSSASTELTW